MKHIDPAVANDRLLAHLIAESLLKRIDRQLLKSKNIFIQEFDIPQTTLFYSMAEAVPFVYTGHFLANQYLVAASKGLSSFALLDVGIGNGKQTIEFLRLLAENNANARSVAVIGLDPVERNIECCRKSLGQLGDQLPFKVEFHPICNLIENLSDRDFESIRAIGGDAIFINTAFALHHTAHPLDDETARTDLLRRLARLEPRLITLVEPSSNHDTEKLPKRFHHSWQHYGNVFALIDEADIADTHKFLIKEKFFGREIRNIFGVSDYFRCERHEVYDSWMLRLHRAGFKPYPYSDLRVNLPSYCRYSVSDGLVRLDYNDLTIVAVLAFSL